MLFLRNNHTFGIGFDTKKDTKIKMILTWNVVMFEYVFPSFGCLIASCVFASPIKSLNHALTTGSLGNLNPKPWSVMTGNCLGWCAYAFYTDDPFVLAGTYRSI